MRHFLNCHARRRDVADEGRHVARICKWAIGTVRNRVDRARPRLRLLLTIEQPSEIGDPLSYAVAVRPNRRAAPDGSAL